VSALSRPFPRLALAAGAVAALAVFYVASYGGATGTFFSFDDYWVMARADEIGVRGPLDVWRFFTLDHNGFVMYRPLSTTAYFWLLHALFGYDPAGYHAAHLALCVADAALVYGIATQALGRPGLGLATALLYAAAPGLAIAAYWVALCTVTGTAFFYLLALRVWLGTRRRLAVVPVFLVALACAEHAVTLPLTLTLAIVLLEGRWPGRADLPALVPLYAIMIGYIGAKLVYFKVSLLAQFLLGIGYGITANPVSWLENLGRYGGYASALPYPLVAPGLPASRPVALALGGLLALAAAAVLVAARPGRPLSRETRVAAFGVAAFPVMLGPVLLLGNHLYGYYVAIAAAGLALATIAGLAALPRLGRWAPAVGLIATLAVHAGHNLNAVEREPELAFYRGFTRATARWLYTVQTIDREHPEAREVVIKRGDFTTSILFVTGAYRLLLPGIRIQIRLVNTPSRYASEPGTVVLDAPYERPAGLPLPGARPEWDWLRAAPPP
jgi:hypothetical protein